MLGRAVFAETTCGLIASPTQSADTIHGLFAAQALRTPDRTAVTFGGQCWSYAELDRASDRIAAAVAPFLGLETPLVGVSIERSPEMLASLLGVLKAGAAYLPLEPDLPLPRIAGIIDDAQPDCIVGSMAALARLRDGGFFCPLVTLETIDESAVQVRRRVPEDGLAYVIYTSGSTGKPKGVEVRHAGVASLIRSLRTEPGFGPDDTLLATTRMGFDVSVVDFFLPLSCGASIILADERSIASADDLAALIRTSGATAMQATPSLWRSLLSTGWSGAPHLRVWCGGEALTGALANRLAPTVAELWNFYGPTETTVWSSIHRVMTPCGDSVPIGMPVDATTLVVIDDQLRPVRSGDVGELCIAGIGVARGYRGRSDLTADRFVRIVGIDGPVYRSGDLARIGDDGLLHCLGRLDDQVKIRGHRVEMGEIEAAMARYPGVAVAAVRCFPDAIGENALFAYVVADDRETATLAGLATFVRDQLPAYMVPYRIFRVSALATTSNGKIDRNALPRPDTMPDESIVRMMTSGSLSATEQSLASIWQSLLEIRIVGCEDDFFDLGGYSLLTVQLMLRIEEDFGRLLSIADLLDHSTLRLMAGLIEKDPGMASGNGLVRLKPSGDKPPLFWLDGGPILRGVARELPSDQPMLGLNLSAEEERPFRNGDFDIEQLAATLLRKLKMTSPDGPYHVGGWCRWGIVAYELAQQLRAAGDDVSLLVLLDVERPGTVRLKWRDLFERFKRLLHRMARGDAPLPQTVSQHVLAKGERYKAADYGGRTALIRPTVLGDTCLDGGWQRSVSGPLTIYRTPGTHVSMVRAPHAQALAAAIGMALAAVH